LSSKFHDFTEIAPEVVDFEGAITSSANIRPDELVLRNIGSKWNLLITFSDGKKMELSVYLHPQEKNLATLVVPEKYYKEAEKLPDMQAFLSGILNNQRSLEVTFTKRDNQMVIQPVNAKKDHFKLTFAR
jgi:hypothetical protein